MTLAELKQISDQSASDEEFLRHPQVKAVYWQGMDELQWSTSDIPGSFADAVERMRQKVWYRYEHNIDMVLNDAFQLIGKDECRCLECWQEGYFGHSLRTRFMMFAAGLEAVEVPEP